MTQDDVVREVLRAAKFAADKHRDQRRKDEKASPYINHPIGVAEVLARHGVRDPVVLVAAVLHDTIEDTDTTGTELEREFGPEVRRVVEEVTDDKSLNKDERKARQIEKAPTLSPEAKLVKIADKISNITDVIHSPPTEWPMERRAEYLSWTRAVVDGCQGVNVELERTYAEILSVGAEKLGDNMS
jgi:GTP diphosphokinase / guanosine-3',5'-bis(diphosphate) 3'-diphosphatase